MTLLARLTTATLSASLATALACAPYASPTADSAAAGARADLWDWCPSAPASPADVDEERLWLQFGPEALYCSLALPSWDGSLTVWDQLAQKAQLRLVPADNFLPKEAGEHDVTLPMCSRAAFGSVPSQVEEGRLVVEETSQIGRTRLALSYKQTARDEDGAALTAHVRISGYEEDLAPGVLLDGSEWPLPDPDVELTLCQGEVCGADEPKVKLDTCAYDGPRELHHVRFDGGELMASLETAAGTGSSGTAPLRAHLRAVTGTLGGETFEQQSYWRLIARETWPWSSARDFAVRLDAPVAGVCGLWGTQLYPEGGGFIELMLCDGTSSRREVLSHTVSLEDDKADAGTVAP